jgi:hypothetical protein
MADKTPEELQADWWLETISAVAFRNELNSETDEFRYKILSVLLANEIKNLREQPFL